MAEEMIELDPMDYRKAAMEDAMTEDEEDEI